MHISFRPLRAVRLIARRLWADRSAAALLEFALGLPILLTAGLWGIELTHFALVHQRLSQLALELADNASRVGLYSGQTTIQLREVDLNDVLQATRLHGDNIDLTTNGRVTLSSLEADSSGNQIIHWQRCIGLMSGAGYDSTYGITATTHVSTGTTYDPTAAVDTDSSGADNSASHPGSATTGGMGDTGAKVVAPNNAGVMFVEINYLYTPMVGNGWFAGPQKLHYIASFIVRDNRDFTEVYNPTPAATRSTCDVHAV